MRILHTSDWHLGRSLYGKKRYEEFSAFLLWLIQTIEDEKIDILLVAGDVFDSSLPSNKAQELYYNFLYRVANSYCQHVVIIAGNHDSSSFLNAPKELLQALNIYVVAACTETLDDEVIVLYTDHKPQAIICAVPYLRDKDIRTVEAGETIDDKNLKLLKGLQEHYDAVCLIAEQKQKAFKADGFNHIPIIAMGHLFTAGGKTSNDDGVRELYVGSLAHVEKDVFPSIIDYLALGHLHVPQKVANLDHMRYCGSPIPMGYGEAKQEKQVIILEFDEKTPKIQEIPVPCFQVLERITGSWDDISSRIQILKKQQSSAWLEIEYTANDLITNLCEQLDALIIGSNIKILRIKNRQMPKQAISSLKDDETLDDLNLEDVFIRCLDIHKVANEDRQELIISYQEIIKNLMEDDVNAE